MNRRNCCFCITISATSSLQPAAPSDDGDGGVDITTIDVVIKIGETTLTVESINFIYISIHWSITSWHWVERLSVCECCLCVCVNLEKKSSWKKLLWWKLKRFILFSVIRSKRKKKQRETFEPFVSSSSQRTKKNRQKEQKPTEKLRRCFGWQPTVSRYKSV
jgi:hypothetical protein